ncbi:glucosidase 2 subunit beta [Chelonus insularis]|uniref:glucosidase 2 subunit beta n=1 Tax=Chelonus insularis TaxID=460826 RepID=UPI00158EC4B9|nr:glucosidase 2 subunit beta [Chelonus insularis]
MMNYLLFFGVSSIVLSFDLSHVTGTQVLRLRGVSLPKSPLYNPEKDFECLDGSRRITFNKVNDDYCDCGDGSDEPGTAACYNGFFFCENTGFRSIYIPSSRVNDGICDCCDASDEYASGVSCIDNCYELGREARAEAEKAAELAREGSKIKLEMSQQGQKLRTDNVEKLSQLKAEYLEAERVKKEKEVIKTQAEERESAALEKYKPEPEPIPEETEKPEGKEIEAEEYFKKLDSDESKSVTIQELQTRIIFDRDGNGVITEEEAMYFLGQDEVNLDEFIEKSWIKIKPFMMKEQGLFRPPTGEEDAEELHEDMEEEHGEEDEHELEEEEGDHSEAHEEPEKPEEPAIQYDEETQAIINEANEARNQYQEVEKVVMDLQNQIRSIEAKVDRDYGPGEVFATLDGTCYQYTDLEYVYSMCMFGRASQSAKSGGSEVSLGHWSEWIGPEHNKYSRMKFDKGLTCWNGPARSTVVDLRCGTENKLVSVSEPSRCEYAMIFTTPALCTTDSDSSSVHDEL